jgi:hypothetical protein
MAPPNSAALFPLKVDSTIWMWLLPPPPPSMYSPPPLPRLLLQFETFSHFNKTFVFELSSRIPPPAYLFASQFSIVELTIDIPSLFCIRQESSIYYNTSSTVMLPATASHSRQEGGPHSAHLLKGNAPPLVGRAVQHAQPLEQAVKEQRRTAVFTLLRNTYMPPPLLEEHW